MNLEYKGYKKLKHFHIDTIICNIIDFYYSYMGTIFSSEEYELDTTHIEYYHNIFQNCGIAGIYVPLPYVKKNKLRNQNNLGDSFNSDISITSTSSLNEIVAAKHLSRISMDPDSILSNPTNKSNLSTPSFSSTLSNRSSRSSQSDSTHSIETIPLN